MDKRQDPVHDRQKISDKMEIMLVCYEPVTGSHVGPGALALFFEGDTAFRLEA